MYTNTRAGCALCLIEHNSYYGGQKVIILMQNKSVTSSFNFIVKDTLSMMATQTDNLLIVHFW